MKEGISAALDRLEATSAKSVVILLSGKAFNSCSYFLGLVVSPAISPLKRLIISLNSTPAPDCDAPSGRARKPLPTLGPPLDGAGANETF